MQGVLGSSFLLSSQKPVLCDGAVEPHYFQTCKEHFKDQYMIPSVYITCTQRGSLYFITRSSIGVHHRFEISAFSKKNIMLKMPKCSYPVEWSSERLDLSQIDLKLEPLGSVYGVF